MTPMGRKKISNVIKHYCVLIDPICAMSIIYKMDS